MKIYIDKDNKIDVTNFRLRINALSIDKSSTDNDAVPFIMDFNDGRVYVGTYDKDHTDMMPVVKNQYCVAGRYWKTVKYVSFCGNSSFPYPSSEKVAEIVKKIPELSSYVVVKSLGAMFGLLHKNMGDCAVALIPVSEYIAGGYTGEESCDDLLNRCKNVINLTDETPAKPQMPGKLSSFNGDDIYSKKQTMRMWNGHEVAENKKSKKVIVSENQLRVILKEIASVEIDERAKDVNLNPTEAQKEAGNYKMAHISVKGMEIAIENPKGSFRKFKNDDGTEGRVQMNNHYGYFNITKGKDGDAVDVFIGPSIDNFENVYCVDQNTKEGEFDETKVMLGFTSKDEAKKAYLSNYSPGWTGFRAITGVSLKVFKKWLYRGRKQRQPFADYVYIQKKQLEEARVIGNQAQNQLFYKYVEKAKFYIDLYEKHSEDYNTNFIVWQIDDNKYNESFYIKAVKRALDELQASGMTLQYYKFTTKPYARKKPAE